MGVKISQLGLKSTLTGDEQLEINDGGTSKKTTAQAIADLVTAGSVSSVSVGDLSPIFTSNVATATTTPAITFTLTNAAQNTVLAGPTSGSGTPTYRALVAADIPSLSATYEVLTNKVTDFLTIDNTHYPTTQAVLDFVIARQAGLAWKAPVACATTANITLSGEQTIDGVATSNSRVLVKNQSTQSQNGIYLSGSGSWTRTSDADTGTELEGATVRVQQGTSNADTTWIQTTDGITLGSSNIVFTQFGASVPDATASVKGIAKLYTATGTNTDGSMDQNSITTALGTKQNTITILPVANGGTGTSTEFTDGSIVFSGSSGIYSQNNNNLFWDNSNNRFRVNNSSSSTFTAPQTGTLVHLISSSGTFNGRISLDSYVGSQTTGSIYQGRTAQGTNASPTAAQADQTLAAFGGDGYGTTGFHGASVGSFSVRATSAHTDTNAETYLIFNTTPNASTTSAERMRITSAGSVGIGFTPTSRFHVQGAAAGTASMVKFQNSTPTVVFDMLESGATTFTGSASGAGATPYAFSPTVTATANSQTQYALDVNMTLVDGGFTSLTRSFARFRTGGSATNTYDFGTSTFTTTGLTSADLNGGSMRLRNTTGPFNIQGGSGSTDCMRFSGVFTNSVDNHIAFRFTNGGSANSTALHTAGTAITRIWNAIVKDWTVSSVNGSTITYNIDKINVVFSLGNSTATITGYDYNPDLSGSSGTITHYAMLIRSGNVGIADNTPTEKLSVSGNLKLGTAGNGILIKEGTNATMGVATLVAGTVVVNTTKVTANSRIFLTGQNLGTITVPVGYAVSARTAGTSFTILSANVADTSSVAWCILEPA